MVVDKLDIYDILVTTIPGIAFLLLLYALPPGQKFVSGIGVHANLISATFLVVAYIIGSIVQGVAKSKIFQISSSSNQTTTQNSFGKQFLSILKNLVFPGSESINYEFERRLRQSIEKNPMHLVGTSVEYKFVKGAEQFFGIDFTRRKGFSERVIRTSLLYRLVTSHLQKEEIIQFHRWRMLKTFFRGLWIVFLLSFLVYTFYIAATFLIYRFSGEVVWIVIGIWLFLPIGIIVSNRRRREYGYHQGSTVIEDFYANVLAQNDDIDLSDRYTSYGSNPTLTRDGSLQGWPFAEIDFLKEAVQEEVVEPMKNGEPPRNIGDLHLYFVACANLTELLLDLIIERHYRDRADYLNRPSRQVLQLNEDGFIDESLKGQCLLTLSTPKNMDLMYFRKRGSVTFPYGKEEDSIRKLETHLGLMKSAVKRLRRHYKSRDEWYWYE